LHRHRRHSRFFSVTQTHPADDPGHLDLEAEDIRREDGSRLTKDHLDAIIADAHDQLR